MGRKNQRQRRSAMVSLERRLREEHNCGIPEFMQRWSDEHPRGTLDELAAVLGCHLSTVYRYLEFFDLEVDRTMRIVPHGTVAE